MPLLDSLNKKFNFEANQYALLIDTDSCSVAIDPLCKQLFGEVPTNWTDEQVKKACEYIDGPLLSGLNKRMSEIVKNDFLSNSSFIEFKREKLASSAFFLARKSYSVLVEDDEGVRYKHFIHKGSAIRKVAIPDKLKNRLKELIEVGGMENWSNAQFNDYCIKVYEDMKTWNPSDFCKSLGYSTEKVMVGFDTTGISSSGAIAANFYNNLLKHLKIEDKYEAIKPGDKYRLVYLKPNKFKMEYIGFNNELPKEFMEIFEIDYKTTFEKNFIKPLERYIKAMKSWHAPDVGNIAQFDISLL